MKVEIWSDYQCPYCYIGKRKFAAALEQFAHKEQVEVQFKSFELDPNSPVDYGKSVFELMSEKKGMPIEQMKAMSIQFKAQAMENGLDFQLETQIPTNTFDAHRLMKFAATKGKAEEINEALFAATFSLGKHIGKPEVLVKLAESVGLDGTETSEILASDTFTTEVQQEEAEASRLGITSVPFFVINRKYAISGAQPTEVFLETLDKIWAEEQPLKMVRQDVDDAGCGPDGCEIKK